MPGTSPTVEKNLGLRCGAIDINAACSGFVYGLALAHGIIASGASKVLLIGAETLSRITDWNDRGTAILFADGAAAVVVEAVDGPGQLLAWDLDADGAAQPYLYADVGDYLKMDGREVFRRAVRLMVDSAHQGARGRRGRARRHRPGGAPPGQHPHHRRGLPAPRHPHRADGDEHRPLPATPRRPRSPWPWPRPSRRAASPTATSCCSSGSAPA